MSTSATLATLNETDNAKSLGGMWLSQDGQGNQLWLFGDKVANRFKNEDGEILWSGNVTGWNYEPSDALA